MLLHFAGQFHTAARIHFIEMPFSLQSVATRDSRDEAEHVRLRANLDALRVGGLQLEEMRLEGANDRDADGQRFALALRLRPAKRERAWRRRRRRAARERYSPVGALARMAAAQVDVTQIDALGREELDRIR